MNTKTMEGLVGAKTSMNLINTPMQIYKEARLRSDTAVMERAMGYVGELSDQAEAYSAKASAGMKEDAKEAKEKAAVEEDSDSTHAAVSKDRDDTTRETVIYTKTGGVESAEPSASISVSV